MRWHYDTVEANYVSSTLYSIILPFYAFSVSILPPLVLIALKNHLTVPDRRLGATDMMSCLWSPFVSLPSGQCKYAAICLLLDVSAVVSVLVP